MTTMSASQARSQLPEALNRVAYGGDRVVIKRRGKVLGVLVSEADLALLEAAEDKYWAKEARKAMAAHKRSGGRTIAWEDLRKKLGV